MTTRLRIAVVTPLFPISSEPYRGQPIYKTVLALTEMADVETFYVSASYPPLLRPRSYQYKTADPGWQPEGVKTHYLRYPTVPVLGRRTNAAASARVLESPLRQFRPDVILAYWIFPEGLGAVRVGQQLGVPVVVGSRGSDLLKIPDGVSAKGVREALAGAAATVVVSGELHRRAIELGAPPSRVHTILNGCDRSIFSQQDTVAARRRLGFPEDAELVLFVGHLIRDKGIGDLIEAWERLSGKRRRLRLAFIGEGSMESSLRKLDQERVLLLGPKTAGEVAQWLAACNLLCLPSYSEGCPNVVLEALACGRPVVATTVGAIPDLLDDTCGIQVPPGNARALKNALAEALESSWDSSLIARRHGRGWQDAAAETLEVCRRAARLSAPPG